MPFIERDASGTIVAIYRENKGDEEYLAHDDAEVMAFLAESDPFFVRRKQLSETDFQLIRSIEDVIQLLIDKEVIDPGDLPEPVQQLLDRRQMLRGVMKDLMAEFGDL